MTKQECAIVMAYTGYVMLRGDDLDLYYEYIEKLIGRPVWTHEIPMLSDKIQQRSKDDFLKLCATAE